MNQIKVYQGKILVRAPFELREQLRDIPTARWLTDLKCWSFNPTPAVALRLDTVLSTYQSDDSFENLLAQAYAIGEAQMKKEATDLPPIPSTKNPAWRHQLQAFWFIANLWGGLPTQRGGRV